MSFEVAFITGHGIFDQGASAFFPCVDCERSLSLFSYSCRCTFFVMRFPSGILAAFRGLLWDFLVRFDAFYLHSLRMRIPLWEFMLFATSFANEICWWDFMLFGPYESSRDFFVSFHAFLLHNCLMRLPYEISFFLTLMGFLLRLYAFCSTLFVCDFLLKFDAFCCTVFL